LLFIPNWERYSCFEDNYCLQLFSTDGFVPRIFYPRKHKKTGVTAGEKEKSRLVKTAPFK